MPSRTDGMGQGGAGPPKRSIAAPRASFQSWPRTDRTASRPHMLAPMPSTADDAGRRPPRARRARPEGPRRPGQGRATRYSTMTGYGPACSGPTTAQRRPCRIKFERLLELLLGLQGGPSVYVCHTAQAMADDASGGVGLVTRHLEEKLGQWRRVFIPATTHCEGELPEQKCKYQGRRFPFPAKCKAALAAFGQGGRSRPLR